MSTAISISAQETGAASVFISSDPAIQRILELFNAGRLKEAESALTGSTDAHVELRELISRLRRDYSLSEPQLLEKLRKQIPDVTSDDLNRWREAGQAQYRTIDGQIKYFRREPSNIFRFCDDAKTRAKKHGGNPDKLPDTKLLNHVSEVVRAAEHTSQAQVIPKRHRMVYRLTVPPESLAPGTLRLWLPYPQEYRQQSEVKLLRAELRQGEREIPVQPHIAPNAIDLPVVQHAQRTIFFECPVTTISQPITAEIEFTFLSQAYYPQLKEEEVQLPPAGWGDAYLRERPPHIVFSDPIRKQVAQIVGEEQNPLRRARKIYHWVDENIRYHAEEEYSLLPSFAQKCFDRRRGDCGVQTMLFITLCRIAGIPARWQSGWESKPSGFNMHDWCEIHIQPYGWIPCDVSYGIQKSDDPKIAEFYIGHQDSYRMIVNLDYGRELDPPIKGLRAEPADFQVGEVELNGKVLFYDKWDYKMRMFVDGVELK